MSKVNKLIISVVVAAAASYIVGITRRYQRDKMLMLASNEGYETAHDVLYPERHKKNRHLRYGPVFPH